MSSSATKFATDFAAALKKESATSAFKEVEQFRAMMRAFGTLRPQYYVEEYHGFRRQIYFDTSHSWLRPRARCELCDVLLLVYSTVGGFSLRATLLQAKLSRDDHITCRSSHAGKVEPQTFHANYEQWDLLSARPALIPTTVFQPPIDLLQAAILPTIGSFGIFHRLPSNAVDLFYTSADCLRPTVTPSGPNSRYGKLSTLQGTPSLRTIGPWTEATYCGNAFDFGLALYQLQIGTPVFHSVAKSAVKTFSPYHQWIRSVLSSHLAASGANAPLARTLLNQLGGVADAPQDSDALDGVKQPGVVVLRSEQPVAKNDA